MDVAAREILSLIQVGFAGFASAMALLAYRLINKFISKQNPSITLVTLLKDFVRYTLYLSLIVILAMFVEHGFDYISKRLVAQEADRANSLILTSQAAQNCRESLNGLVGSESANRNARELANIMKLAYASCAPTMQTIETASRKPGP